ncbi:M48 family metalloprotease [Vampirovibrio chlorellavorus]|uniref:M48 family metalloprotease n=1 Tax=Vampirovibrio chlorellavorus TaxID=758823 RepID=UPI0026F3027D|nr:M48 family metalloprotease [Vampirovibrio chlorellavorus]
MNRSRLVLMALLYLWGWLCAWACPGAWAEGEEDPLWNRPSFEKKVFRVGQRILSANGIPDRIEFLASRLDIRNASASRFGGPNTVIIYKDMLDVMESDDELAAVLSHEIAHITKRHTGKIVPKRWAAKTALWTAYTVGGTAASVATAGLAAPVFIVGAAGIKKMHRNGIALTDPISRPYEKEADLVGLEYMTKAGYNPLAMESLLLKGAADSGPVANFFSSHPGGSERLAYIHEAIQSHYPQYLADANESAADAKNAALPKAGAVSPADPVKMAAQFSALAEGKDNPNHQHEGSVPSSQAALNPSSLPARSKAPRQQSASAPQSVPASQSVSTGGSQSGPEKSVQSPAKSPAAQPVAASTASASVASSSPSNAKALFAKPAAPSAGPGPHERSVAQVLLGLQPDQLRILRMLSQHGYLSRQELVNQMEYVPADSLTQQINALIQKRLVRLLGAEPDEVIVLTDWAAEAFQPASAR